MGIFFYLFFHQKWKFILFWSRGIFKNGLELFYLGFGRKDRPHSRKHHNRKSIAQLGAKPRRGDSLGIFLGAFWAHFAHLCFFVLIWGVFFGGGNANGAEGKKPLFFDLVNFRLFCPFIAFRFLQGGGTIFKGPFSTALRAKGSLEKGVGFWRFPRGV